MATATGLELAPIWSSRAPTSCLCTGCNGSGQAALLLVVHFERVAVCGGERLFRSESGRVAGRPRRRVGLSPPSRSTRCRVVGVAGPLETPPCAATVASLVDAGRVPGLVIGRLNGAATSIEAHGRVRPDAIFEIGSLTKPFTGLLLAELAASGELALDATLARVMPRDALRLRPRLREATLLDLATHTAGLPRLPARILVRALRSPTDPYASISADDVTALAPIHPRQPRERFRYSNYGYMLLGRALEIAAGQPFAELLAARVCAPLELNDTGFAVTPTQSQRVVRGHGRHGRAAPAWGPGGAPAAGGLRSTVEDLLRVLAALLGNAPPALERAVELALALRLVLKGRDRGVTLGWFTTPHYYMHTGGTGGFGAFAGFHRQSATGLVVLVNHRYWDGLQSVALNDLRSQHSRQEI